MELTCPKCHGTMRTYERNGVHVDQCTECRGLFLDRGELEKLIDAENDWHDRDQPQRSAAPAAHQPSGRPAEAGLGAVVGEVLSQVRGQQHGSRDRYDDDRHRYDDSRHRYGGDRQYAKKRKESFLGDLFG